MINDFYTYVSEKEVIFDRVEIGKDTDYIKSVLKAEIAGAIWGKSAYYNILVSNDLQITKARAHFEDAEKFLLAN